MFHVVYEVHSDHLWDQICKKVQIFGRQYRKIQFNLCNLFGARGRTMSLSKTFVHLCIPKILGYTYKLSGNTDWSVTTIMCTTQRARALATNVVGAITSLQYRKSYAVLCIFFLQCFEYINTNILNWSDSAYCTYSVGTQFMTVLGIWRQVVADVAIEEREISKTRWS